VERPAAFEPAINPVPPQMMREAIGQVGFPAFGADDVFTLVSLSHADLDRMAALVEAYSSLPLGAADASVIAVAERLKLTEVATLDRRLSQLSGQAT
jgi:predicted nucleic acid-binding protein